jgi:hypothetical protein
VDWGAPAQPASARAAASAIAPGRIRARVLICSP